MKTPLWTLLLLGLCNPTWCDCKNDCLYCSQKLPKESAFNHLVCLVECHGKLSPCDTWEMCRRSLVGPKTNPPSAIKPCTLKRADEEPEEPPMDQEDGQYSESLQRFDQVTRAFEREDQDTQMSEEHNSLQQEESVDQREEGDQEEEEEADIHLTKRFGGFLKNKYGYRKFIDPGRSLNKRYGGFIGVRKSARKWNNQKRFSEFLKQYLGMSARASEYDSVSTDVSQQNE